MIKIIISYSIIATCLIACKNNQHEEDPYEIARAYCHCLDKQMNGAKDSSVDLYSCEEKAFSKSRLLGVEKAEDNSSYSKATRDSAFDFLLTVGRITDTMCLNKITRKKIKKTPHIRM